MIIDVDVSPSSGQIGAPVHKERCWNVFFVDATKSPVCQIIHLYMRVFWFICIRILSGNIIIRSGQEKRKGGIHHVICDVINTECI